MKRFRCSLAFFTILAFGTIGGSVSAQTPPAAHCCACQKNGQSICVQFSHVTNCSDLSGSAAVQAIQNGTSGSLLNGFTCTNLTTTQCAIVAQHGQCTAPPISEGALQTTLQNMSASGAGSGTAGGTTGGAGTGSQSAGTGAATGNNAPLPSIVPTLSIPIPGVTFTPATQSGDGVDVPFLAQYISGIYRYLLGISVLVATIMVVYGGFKYVVGATPLATGDGKKIIQDAIGGLVVLLCAHVILSLVDPELLNLKSLHLLSIQSTNVEMEAGMAEAGSLGTGEGPSSYCRDNLRVVRPGVYCATCGSQVPCGMHTPPTPDAACLALVGPCGGMFGHFLDGLTERCQVKRFDWLEGLDGGTFGILHYTENNFAGLLHRLEERDPAAYERVRIAGNNTEVTNTSVCSAQRTDGGFICNPDMQAMMRVALREPSFTKVQLEDAYHQYQTRMGGASNHFRSAFGQLMWAIASNNPGSCGASFSNVIAACPAFSGSDENAKIECFLQKFEELGCRGGVASAGRRVTAIRHWLQDVSRVPGAIPPAPDLPTLEACIPGSGASTSNPSASH